MTLTPAAESLTTRTVRAAQWRLAGSVVGTLVGSRYGLPGVAVGVSIAILYMFVASGHLALSATGTPWRVYLRVQFGAVVITGITGAVALSVRLLLEATHVPAAAIALSVMAAAAIPWSLGILWTLGEPEFELLRAGLPCWCMRLVETLRRRRAAGQER